MTKRRLAMAAAILVLVGSAAVLFKSGHTARSLPVRTTTVVLATHDIAPLQTLQQDDLQVKTVPVGTLPGALATAPFGSTARVPLVSGQAIMPADIGPAIPAGDAVLGIGTSLAQSSGMVRPGQTVEVISVASSSGAAQGTSEVLGQATVLVLESAQGNPVVPGLTATSGKTAATSTNAQVPAEASLLVPQAIAPKIAAADAKGKIYLAVVP